MDGSSGRKIPPTAVGGIFLHLPPLPYDDISFTSMESKYIARDTGVGPSRMTHCIFYSHAVIFAVYSSRDESLSEKLIFDSMIRSDEWVTDTNLHGSSSEIKRCRCRDHSPIHTHDGPVCIYESFSECFWRLDPWSADWIPSFWKIDIETRVGIVVVRCGRYGDDGNGGRLGSLKWSGRVAESHRYSGVFDESATGIHEDSGRGTYIQGVDKECEG